MFKNMKLLFLLGIVFVNASPHGSNDEFVSDSYNQEHEQAELHKVHRLSDDVNPLSYELKMIPDLERFTFKGKVNIEVLIKFSTNKIELHSRKLKILSCILMKGSQTINIKFRLDEFNDLLIIEVAQRLAFQTRYSVTIEFEGGLSDEMLGFYRSSYTIRDREYWLAATQFEGAYAREAFPCFDEPRFRAPFNIYLAHFENQTAVSNLPIESVLPPDLASGIRIWTKFQETPPMVTYLVSFMVSDFIHITDPERRINVWARKNAIQQTPYALSQSTKLLRQLEGYTGIPYKLPKLDVVAIPDFKAGAMENWGMATFKEQFVILDDVKSSEAHKARVTQVICHEFSHMWFGDLVTPAWWDYVWLNEGFARYFEYFAANEVEPSWNLDQLFVIECVQQALLNEIPIQREMSTRVTTKQDINNGIYVINYPKAASVIRMFEHMVSPQTFKTALHNYLKTGYEKRGGTVVPTNLFEAFDEQAYHDSAPLPPYVLASDVMKTWTENIGYPLITVIRNYKTGKIIIKQSTYKSARASKPPPDQEWIVPLTYTTKSELEFSNTSPSLWSFANKETELPIEVFLTDWIILNKQHSGYYRVNYDNKNWQLLIKQLYQEPEKIHVLNRAQLIDDSFAFAYDEIICYYRPLKLVQYLSKELELIPWLSAISHLNILFSQYEGLPVQSLIRTFFLNIIEAPYQHFKFQVVLTDSHLTKVAKPTFLSFVCKIGHQDCVAKALEEYKLHKNYISAVKADLKEIVYCVALRTSEDKRSVFDSLWNEYLKTNIAFDRMTILTSLSCTEDDEAINTILSKLIDSKNKEIRKQDLSVIHRTFFSSRHTIAASIEFIDDKIPVISQLDEYGLSALKDILIQIEQNIKLDEHVKMLEDLETKFLKLNQKKYGHLTKIIHDGCTNGKRRVTERKKKAESLKYILQELLHPDSINTTQTPTDGPNSNSGSVSLVFSLWLCLPVITLVRKIFA